jgi:hypothetical protein
LAVVDVTGFVVVGLVCAMPASGAIRSAVAAAPASNVRCLKVLSPNGVRKETRSALFGAVAREL